MRDPPEREKIREWLAYNPYTGSFMWKKGRNKGQEAGHIRSDGYVQIKFLSRDYLAHHLAWILMTGKPPTSIMDHIDHNKNNNSFDNLREVTKSENGQNVKRKGYCIKNGRYVATIMVNGKSKYLGSYSTEEEASNAYLNAKKTLHSVASDNCF